METLVSYIEDMFMSMPDSDNVRRAKEKLLLIMVEKYRELKSEGHSENEAVGIVISEFGNIDDILDEAGMPDEQVSEEFANTDGRTEISMDTVKEYVSASKKSALRIGLGVLMCIYSPLFLIYTEDIIKKHIAEGIGSILLLIIIAAAIGIFIINSGIMGKYEYIRKDRLIYSDSVRKIIEEEKQHFVKIRSILIVTGIAVCVISIIPIIYVEEYYVMPSVAIENLSTSIMIILIGVAAMIFIFAGCVDGCYNTLLEERNTSIRKSKEEKKEEKTFADTIADIYWAVITCAYLVYSFITFDWGRSWIIWPLAGILYGAASSLFKIAGKEYKKKI